jgi:integrase/recombinase XerD
MVPIGERACAWVAKYIDDARAFLAVDDVPELFINDDGAAFNPNQLTQLVGRYVRKAELGKVGSCHMFRHTMATLMLDGGADVRYIQAILGHARLSTTEIYTHVAISRLQAVHRASHPSATLERRPRTAAELHTELDDDAADLDDEDAISEAELLDDD